VFVTAKIQKKDGTLQDYNRTKLLLSMMRAQASPDEAEQALSAVESWLSQLSVQSVNAQEIHIKVAEALKSINPQVAENYEIYRKSHAKSKSQ